MKVVGQMVLHYGRPYIAAAIQSVIDSVDAVEDTAMIAAFEHERPNITEKIFKGLRLHDRGIGLRGPQRTPLSG